MKIRLDGGRWQALLVLMIVAVLILYFVIKMMIIPFAEGYNDKDDPTYYDTGNIEDMTKEEYEDFLKWKEKQEDKEKMFD